MVLKQRDRLLVVCRCAQSCLINQKDFFLVLCRVLRIEKKSCKTLIHKTLLKEFEPQGKKHKKCVINHTFILFQTFPGSLKNTIYV